MAPGAVGAAVIIGHVDSKILKKDLPIDRIWNHPSQPLLRLITCGGKWDASIGHYLSNLIVSCHLVK